MPIYCLTDGARDVVLGGDLEVSELDPAIAYFQIVHSIALSHISIDIAGTYLDATTHHLCEDHACIVLASDQVGTIDYTLHLATNWICNVQHEGGSVGTVPAYNRYASPAQARRIIGYILNHMDRNNSGAASLAAALDGNCCLASALHQKYVDRLGVVRQLDPSADQYNHLCIA